MEVFYQGNQVFWSQGIPQSKTGDLRMVTAWSELGFVINQSPEGQPPSYALVEAANFENAG
jgi:hypothetical protein